MIQNRIKKAEAATVARIGGRSACGMTQSEIEAIREFGEGDTLAQIPENERTGEQSARLAELQTQYDCDFSALRAWTEEQVN